MKTFEELGISKDILKAINEMGFENPMPVQEEVIPHLLEKDTDIIALAQTGTGKTAAYGLPIIQQTDVANNHIQSLILCPTRELCLQITDDLREYSKYCPGIKILPVYGGSSIDVQISALKKGVQIVVATPGRLIDMIKRKAAKLNNVQKVVLDEADEMLNMGFLEDINEILAEIPKERNTLLFSATMPDEIAKISKKYMTNPIEVVIGRKNQGAENVNHVCYTVHAKDKYLALKRIADSNPNIYGIIFCRTRRDTQEVADKLMKDGYNADALHGDLSQAQRDSVMQKFRFQNIKLLVATDVAARGLDVDNLTHIINYSLPDDYEVYTHRSGRTGRAGKKGTSIIITNLKENRIIQQIEHKINKKFTHDKVPTGKEICEKQLFCMIDKMEKVEVDHEEINKFLPQIFRKLEWLDKEEIITRFVSLEFNRFLEYYRNAKELSAPEERGSKNDNWRERNEWKKDKKAFDHKPDSGYTRIFINLGKANGLTPGSLIELLNKNIEGKRIPVGKIDLLNNFSFFEVEKDYAKHVFTGMKNSTFKGVPIGVEIAQEKKSFNPDRDSSFKKNKSEKWDGDFKKKKKKERR